MNARATRILKEERSLFWPWCAVTVVGVLPLVRHQAVSSLIFPEIPPWMVEDISFVGFFFGIPLLAALSFGNEFQHRTISLLLSQPVRRMEIWGEKVSVMIAAVASAALVFGIGWRATLQQDPELWVMGGAWVIAILASAAYWTLVARSLLGGLALNAGVHSLVLIVKINLPYWFPGIRHLSPAESTTARWAGAFVLLSYACVMVWLGRRRFARFQVTGAIAGDDLMMAGPDVMPRALAGWFRCRPSEPVLNLIRKELRLLRPVWLISLLAIPVWVWLPAYGRAIERSSTAAVAMVLMVVGLIPLIAVLAGTLSLGEERTSGTHTWHMTLPVPARRQWLIKLVMAMFAGVVCPALVPIAVLMAGGRSHGWTYLFEHQFAVTAWLFAFALLCFASFWCASAVNGTVRAALWVFPVMIALSVAASLGERVADRVIDTVLSRGDFFSDFSFTRAVSHLNLFVAGVPPLLYVLILLVPTLVFATIQSYRLFRKQLQDSPLFVVRRLVPLAAITFLCSFSLAAFYIFVARAPEQMEKLFLETHQAIQKFQPAFVKLDDGHPLQLSGEDLAKAYPLSERTRRWLRDSQITVTPAKPHAGPFFRGEEPQFFSLNPDQDYSWYAATIRLPGGSACTMSFETVRVYGILGGVCE
jgi:ABC-type transport system involved in multi-copper enzyme maturation permease subunit